MAKAIRFTKTELEAIRVLVLGEMGDTQRVDIKKSVCERILDKLELAELPVKKTSYLTVKDAIDAFRGVLGNRLVAPRYEALGVLGQMKNRIQALGLTRQDCVTVARVASAKWQGLVRAESLVRQADKLLAESQLELPSTPQGNVTSPVELGNEDI